MNRLLAIALSSSGMTIVSRMGLHVARRLRPAAVTWCCWRPPHRIEVESIPLSLGECPLGGSSILVSMSLRAESNREGESLPPDSAALADALRLGVQLVDLGTVTDPAVEFAQRVRAFDLILLERGADDEQLARFLDVTDRPVLLCPAGAARLSRIVVHPPRRVSPQALDLWGRHWADWLGLPIMSTAVPPLDGVAYGAATDLILIDRRDIPRKWWSLESGLLKVLRRWPEYLCILPGSSNSPIRGSVWWGSAETDILDSGRPLENAAVCGAGVQSVVR